LKRATVILVLTPVALCLCLVACLTVIPVAYRLATWPRPALETPEPTPTLEVPRPTPTPGTPEPTPTLPPIMEVTPTPQAGVETWELLEKTEVPVRDLIALTKRLKHVEGPIPKVVRESALEYEVGDEEIFWVSNVDTDEHFQITALLLYATPHLYMWVEKGVDVDLERLKEAADIFEEKTYPTDREFFGSEWTPGVDSDPHLNILHARGLGNSVAGYYSSADEYSRIVHEFSNEREIFYINAETVTIGNDFYNNVLAHEFQHMIHWYNDQNEDTWLNEGFSELAAYLNGYETGGVEMAFGMRSDTQLNSWPDETGEAAPNYGAAYVFTLYFLERFGEEATRALVAHPANGIASVDAVLLELGYSFDELFADWVVANYLDDPSLEDGRYGYRELWMGVADVYPLEHYPVERQETVHQYAADYILVQPRRDLEIDFQGATWVKVIDNEAHSGRYQWWSNRSDESDTTLTRAFDLSGLESATLEFWTWYDIEEDWDYAYVEVSTNGGQTWDILQAPSTTDYNPNGNNFGWAYTGMSGGGEEPRWIREGVDLSDYAGGEVLIRFEYITDDAVIHPGFAVDDIWIPELDYDYDAERDDGWEAEGFIRMENILPQRWIVQVIEFAGRETRVHKIELDEEQGGEYFIDGDEVDEVVLVISALAPSTTEVAGYRYEVREVE
jgi:immune inhibitor A